MGRNPAARPGRRRALPMQAPSADPSAASIADRIGLAAPWFAAAFVGLCLAIIPYGAPFSRVYGLVTVACCVAMLACARISTRRWDHLVLWPALLPLFVQALGCVMSVDPPRSMARFATMPLFAMVLVAVQLAASDRRALRCICVMGATAALVIVVDVALARFAHRSLFQGDTVATTRTAGSQGNANDLAAASLLLPLAWLVVPQSRSLAWYAACAAVVALAWVLSAGRQVAIGWAIATIVPIAMHLGWRRASWAMLATIVLAAIVVMIEPTLRARLGETLSNGLGARKALLAFGTWLWWQKPWIGHGPGTFGELYMQAALSDWSWNGLTLARMGMPWPHNLLIEVLDDLGVMGLVAFAIPITVVLRRAHRALAQGTEARRLAVCAITMAVTIAAVGMVDLSFIKDWFRCVFWLAMGLGCASSQATSTATARSTSPTWP